MEARILELISNVWLCRIFVEFSLVLTSVNFWKASKYDDKSSKDQSEDNEGPVI